MLRRACFIFGHLLLILLFAGSTSAQTKPQNKYLSPSDAELDLRKIVIAPFSDNVSGIYSVPAGEQLRELLSKDLQWSLIDFPQGSFGRPESYENHPDQVRKLLKSAQADAVLTGRITRGPAGLSYRLLLFVGPSGLPLLVEEKTDASMYETKAFRNEISTAFWKMRSKMPYQGLIVSRQGQAVTFNVGRNSGIRDGDEISVIQILKIQRHPKLQFMVGADKEILGKLRVTKADDELSFANILSEKDVGVVSVGMKIEPTKMVHYPEPVVEPGGAVVDSLQSRPDRPVAFGEKPIEWLPEHAPQFGRLQIKAGIGQYTTTAALQTAGTIDGSSNLVPNLGVMGEAWITADWFLGFSLRQTSFSVANPLSGSSPGTINMSTSKYEVFGGRHFLLSEDFMGPKLQLSLGLGKFSARADETTPVAFSNMEYGGINLGLQFSTPIDPKLPWEVGAAMRYYWDPGLSESVSSGSTRSVSVSDFSFLLNHIVRQNFRYLGELNLEYYSSDFSGGGARPDPATNISHRSTTLLLGIEYSF